MGGVAQRCCMGSAKRVTNAEFRKYALDCGAGGLRIRQSEMTANREGPKVLTQSISACIACGL
jgi:hypothetical protein